MGTADRVLSVLGLFTMEQPEWTVDKAMRELGLSSSTAYQYFRSLVDAGLLIAGKTGRYSIGPEVISLDRITRRYDPLVREAREIMHRLIEPLRSDAVGLLCRSFRSQVMCIDQHSEGATFGISYERGRPMPLYRGAASKVILAQLSSRATRRLWDTDSAAIKAAGLGEDWEGFKRSLRELRKHKAMVTRGELDKGLVGISSAVYDADDTVCGSIGIVASADRLSGAPGLSEALADMVFKEACGLSEKMRG